MGAKGENEKEDAGAGHLLKSRGAPGASYAPYPIFVSSIYLLGARCVPATIFLLKPPLSEKVRGEFPKKLQTADRLTGRVDPTN